MTITADIVQQLGNLLPGAVATDVSLAAISRWRVGGTADIVVTPRSLQELVLLRSWISHNRLPSLVIGATTNLLFADEGLRVICIQIGHLYSEVTFSRNEIVAQPGAWVPAIARLAMKAGLSGIEHTCGIPGTLGGLVCMNGGSQRKGIGDTIVSVVSVDATGAVITRSRNECEFEYRRSIFQRNNEVVAEVVLALSPTRVRAEMHAEQLAILRERRRKFPQKMPNCGSVFVSNPAMYAQLGPPGAVIERLGFKGKIIGGAMVSPLHANFIVNLGGALARDIVGLISLIKAAVYEKTGYALEVEARYVSENGDIVPADAAESIHCRATA